MAYDLSFTKREWWGAIAGVVLLAVLMFAFGFVSGALWQRRPTAAEVQVPPPAAAQPATAATAAKPNP